MAVPGLCALTDEIAYRRAFEEFYCKSPLLTHDGITVRFRKEHFDHCCYLSSNKNEVKDAFCPIRAQHIGWIFHALTSGEAEQYVGWDKKKKLHDPNRRVAILDGKHLTVIALRTPTMANFVTAYVAEPYAVALARKGPVWA